MSADSPDSPFPPDPPPPNTPPHSPQPSDTQEARNLSDTPPPWHAAPLPCRRSSDPRFPAVTAAVYVRMIQFALAHSAPTLACVTVPATALDATALLAQGGRYHIAALPSGRVGWVRLRVTPAPSAKE